MLHLKIVSSIRGESAHVKRVFGLPDIVPDTCHLESDSRIFLKECYGHALYQMVHEDPFFGVPMNQWMGKMLAAVATDDYQDVLRLIQTVSERFIVYFDKLDRTVYAYYCEQLQQQFSARQDVPDFEDFLKFSSDSRSDFHCDFRNTILFVLDDMWHVFAFQIIHKPRVVARDSAFSAFNDTLCFVNYLALVEPKQDTAFQSCAVALDQILGSLLSGRRDYACSLDRFFHFAFGEDQLAHLCENYDKRVSVVKKSRALRLLNEAHVAAMQMVEGENIGGHFLRPRPRAEEGLVPASPAKRLKKVRVAAFGGDWDDGRHELRQRSRPDGDSGGIKGAYDGKRRRHR